MRRALGWIAWIGWALAFLLAPLFAGRAIATLWAWATWPLTVGPKSLYQVGSVEGGEALAAHWMTWEGIGWTLGPLILFASALVYGVAHLPKVRGLPRALPAALVWLFALGQTAYWVVTMIRNDRYWDMFINVPA
ncbi:hypothetical protein [Brevundimonas sp.]|uniref:hypothetical protein n=1 Tax=Brevundimonas sp. TaxID=1871086 RepID=UPI0035AEDEAB